MLPLRSRRPVCTARLLAALAAGLAACADAPRAPAVSPRTSTSDTPSADEPLMKGSYGPDDRVYPPWDWAPLWTAASRTGRSVLCLTFDGEIVSDEESFIVPQGEVARIPPFDVRPLGLVDRGAAIAAIIGRVRAYFERTDLEIVDVCPVGIAHTRVIVGGHPSAIGEPDDVAGIAPFDVGNRMEDDIGFVFPEVIANGRGAPDLESVAATIAHEAGHTYGLDHVRPPTDLMHPVVDDRMIGFGAALTLDGHWQDAPALLTAVLGPAGPPPTDAATECDPPEERSGRSREGARAIEPPGEIVGGWSCAADEDWFAIDLEQNARVTLTLTFPTEGWVEPPAIFRPRGRRPVGEGTAAPGEHHWTYRTSTPGRHRIRITTPDERPTRYALRAVVQ